MVLVALRLITDRVGAAREAERRRLVPLLLGQSDVDSAAGGWIAGRQDLLASLSVELIELVQGGDRERFVAAATRLGIPERLRHRLDSGSPRVRLGAAEALAQFDDPKSLARLDAALEDPVSDVRLAAALSLAAVGRPPPARDLVEKLGIGTCENSLLAVALFREVAERRPAELKTLLVDDSISAGAKAAIIQALSASADYSIVPMIVSLAGEERSPAILTRYLHALGEFGHPAGEPAIRRGMQSDSSDVRATAAEAAGRIGLAGLAPHLRLLLGDPVWWVRFRAGEALARLGSQGLAELRSAAVAGDTVTREAASLTLAERGLE